MTLKNEQNNTNKSTSTALPSVAGTVPHQNNVIYFLVPLLAIILKETSALPPIIKIGAIFSEEQRNTPIEMAFKYAVHRINKDNVILPNSKLEYDIRYVKKDDSFHTSKKVCSQVENGVQAIFGPSDPILGAHINSICDALDIPHLEARIDIDTRSNRNSPQSNARNGQTKKESKQYNRIKDFTINLYPNQIMVNKAIHDVMSFLNWTKVAVIYEKNHDLLKLRDLLKLPGIEFYVRQTDPSSYLTVLNEIKHKEIYNLLIDIQPNNMADFLNVILKLQMNEHRYHYLYTTFDIDAFDLDDFKYNFVNITAFRLVDIDDIGIREILKDIKRFQQQQQQKQEQQQQQPQQQHQQQQQQKQQKADSKEQSNLLMNNNKFIETESALMYDSVHVFAIGMQTLEQSHTWRLTNISCANETPWDGGLSLINYINAVEWKGLSGPIEFKEGHRVQFKLDLVKLKQQSLIKVGDWTPHGRLNVTDQSVFFDSGRMNVTLVVITILETPYVMLRPSKKSTQRSHSTKNMTDGNIGDKMSFSTLINITHASMLKGEHHQKKTMVGFENKERIDNTTFSNSHENEDIFDEHEELLSYFDQTNGYTGDPLAHNINRKYAAESGFDGEINQDNMWSTSAPNRNSGVKPAQTENDNFEGFCIDLLRLISEMVGFDYSIELVPDGKYGVYDLETGEWNGIVRELMDKKADLAVGSMTINYARESVIDFTKPFMNLGISILFKVPTSQPTRLFSFMNPLAVDIWLYVLAAYCIVSLTIYIVARFSPYEWHNPHPCDIENNVIENQFTMANSFWFAIGTLMQQGSDLNPKATSTRIVGGIWWFFTLIMISSYTANLAAFLTVERMITPIENAEDLAGQTEISYGTLESGSTMTFFRDSMIETYKKMWRFMENKKPPVFTATYEEGIKRVLDGNYAFLMESTMLDYIVQRDCNLTQIGGLLDTKGYGIATPMGSPWRDKISLAILELQEKGEIQMLYDKWWKNSSDICTSNKAKELSKANALGVDNIGGVFVVLLCGLAFAVLIAILEFCYNSKRQNQNLLYMDNMCMGANNVGCSSGGNCRQHGKHNPLNEAAMFSQNQSLFSDMTEELCFAFRCQGSRQRPAFRRYCSKCQQLQQKYILPTPLAALSPAAPPGSSQALVSKNNFHCVAPETLELQELNRRSFSTSLLQNASQRHDANAPVHRHAHLEEASLTH